MSDYNPSPLPAPRTSTTALISLIAGIAGWSILPFLGSIVAIITGHLAQSEIKKGGGMVTGKGMAVAGLILGYLSVVVFMCIICVAFILPLLGLTLLPWDTVNYY
jgi:hypothetical protein